MCISMSLRRRDQPTLNKCTLRRNLRVLLPHPIATSGGAERAKKGRTDTFNGQKSLYMIIESFIKMCYN
jgi:hypothetical protein